METKRDFIWKMGGQQGQGVESCGEILGRVLAQEGYSLFSQRLFASRIKAARTNAFVSRPDAFWHNYHLVNGACCRMPDAFAALPCHSSWHTDWQL